MNQPGGMTDPAQPNGGHETTDAQSRPVASSLLALLLLVAVSMALMGGLFYYLTHREEALDVSASPVAEERFLPPEPRLQPNPPADLGVLQAADEQQLNSYGWVDRELKLVRIPIDKAIDLMVRRGLPARDARQGE